MQPIAYNSLTRWGQPMVTWQFIEAGSKINDHLHEETSHDSLIVRGRFRITGESERGDCIVEAPDYVRFEPGVVHSLEALTAGAVCVHLFPPGCTGVLAEG